MNVIQVNDSNDDSRKSNEFNCSTDGDNFEEISGDFSALRAYCLSQDKLYEDPDFPANNFSIYRSMPPSDDQQVIEWKRPREIVEEPKFVTEGFSRFDVRQGSLGNCWFIASCASLTSHQRLFDRVVPADNGQFEDDTYAGLFRFRFWMYGRWEDVVIDDRLPVKEDNTLLYMSSSTKNEFWAALLEKAYAKLHGSYQSLKSGTGLEGMVDLTGGITVDYPLKGAEPANMFEILERSLARKSLVTTGINQDTQDRLKSVNLVSSHEYSVTKVSRFDANLLNLGHGLVPNVRLICLRNPWGSKEWNGPWSDSSPAWKLVNDEKISELNIVKEDGEFWMGFEDFVTYFDDISICHQCPNDLDELQNRNFPWEMLCYSGEWKRGSTAGGSDAYSFWRNPQFVITLSANCSNSIKSNSLQDDENVDSNTAVIIGLMQKHNRELGTEFLPIRIHVFPIPDHVVVRQRLLSKQFFDEVAPVNGGARFAPEREVVAKYSLPAGRYVVVPHTWKPKLEGEFFLRIFAEGSIVNTCNCDNE
ncbi:calpain-A-like [Anopheles nili]|uniref:calpain-A-like n=1 Tax=Anopheles nili TaxID=185578 RepID=UPI00237BCF2D|nr:calpain-A-like [Anopheles nili]